LLFAVNFALPLDNGVGWRLRHASRALKVPCSFPSVYFQQISVGTFAKALGFADLAINYLALAAFFGVFLGLSLALLKTQER